ncbi:MAG: tRNA (adenosine(37)-N6)-threonylcarbamoyltransferase complex transferase subunit TsaD [Phototrophicales bacterium]|jgi:N6-L-threonylcarbamoyladenine synthase|nr:MAG: tRNA (adenosine(37)-N6)-threonylcarbamoyltransferase complex transferase subunit TsaD [Phototrophicales bacterium]
MTYILGIESSCDETAAAVVIDGKTIASSVIASQIDLHAQYGGVFPEVASRAHVEAISTVVDQAMREAGIPYATLDGIAVTQGPGLVGSLLVGINYAKGLAMSLNKPLMGINHLEGHVYSLWLTQPFREVEFPVVVLIVSGGHTELLLMRGHGQYERLGGTLDDAAGEAFDKVGRMLNLPFPGGPHIEKAGQNGNASAYAFPRAKRDDSYDFSFSGLKTAVMREVMVKPSGDKTDKKSQLRTDISVNDVAASFQEALVETLVIKTARAAKTYNATEVFLSGGVSANQRLRAMMKKETDLPVRYPPLNLCTDNAAMIAAVAHFRYGDKLKKGTMPTDWDMDVRTMWSLSDMR